MVKNKGAKVILCLIVFIIIFIIISYLAIIFLDSTSRRIGYIYDDNIYESGLIYPLHTYIISNSYEGEISLKTINKSINYFCATYVIELFDRFYKSSTDESIESYYNHNKTSIKKISGITQFDDFYNLVKGICSLDADGMILKRIELEPESVEWDGLDLICEFSAYYEGNQELQFQITIADEIYSKNISPIEYIIIE